MSKDKKKNIPLTDLVSLMIGEVQNGTGRCRKNRGPYGPTVSTNDARRIAALPEIPERVWVDKALILKTERAICQCCGSVSDAFDGIYLRSQSTRDQSQRDVRLSEEQLQLYSKLPREAILEEVLKIPFCLECFMGGYHDED